MLEEIDDPMLELKAKPKTEEKSFYYNSKARVIAVSGLNEFKMDGKVPVTV